MAVASMQQYLFRKNKHLFLFEEMMGLLIFFWRDKDAETPEGSKQLAWLVH